MDFITDNNPKVLLVLEKEASFKKYSSKANKSKQDLEKLSSKAFADVGNREFPINNKANTYMSCVYFKQAGIQDSEVSANLAKASARFKLDADIAAVTKVASKSALNEDNYAVVAEGKGYYPINTPYNVEKSAEVIVEDKGKMPPIVFRTACFGITKAAAKHDITNRIPKEILNVGADKDIDLENFHNGILKRANDVRSKDPVDADVFLELGAMVKKACESSDDETLESALEIMCELDTEHGFNKVAHMEHPYALLYSGEDMATYRKLAHDVVLLEPDGEEFTIPVASFSRNLSKVASTFYEGDAKLKLEKLAAYSDGVAITKAVKALPAHEQKLLLKQIAQFN